MTATKISSKFRFTLLFIILLLNYCAGQVLSNRKKTTDDNYEEQLDKILFKNYNKKLRPPNHVHVKFSFTLNQIINLIEKDQIIVLNAFVDHEWVDKRLQWNPLDYGNLSLIRISQNKIWT